MDDRSEYLVTVRTPEGTSLAATTNVMERIARDIRALPHVLATLTTVGGGTDRAANSGSIYVKLTPKDQRNESQQEMMIKTRDVFKNYPPDLRTSVGVQSWSGSGDVQYAISGPDLDKLSQYSQQLLARLKTLPNVVDADTSLVYGKPELRVEIDRQRAADLGVRVSDIATALNTMIAGQVVSSFPFGRRTIRCAAARRAGVPHQHQRADAAGGVFEQRRSGEPGSSGSHQAGNGAFEHRSSQPAAPGDHQRQPAAGRIAGRRAGQAG